MFAGAIRKGRAGVLWPRPRFTLQGGCRRSVRVLTLLVAILLFNLADLWLTATHITGVGLAEANPVARLVMVHGGLLGLAAYKVGLVSFGLLVLAALRHDRRAELCAWGVAIVMALLMAQWRHYGREMVAAAPAILDAPPRDVWVQLPAARARS